MPGSWPATPGKITHCELYEIPDREGNTYEVRCEYSYTVEGISYTSSRLAFWYYPGSDKYDEEQIYRKLKSAKAVSVRYDPTDPSISSLSYGVHPGSKLTIAFSVVWLLMMLAFNIAAWVLSHPNRTILENIVAQ
ncbi:DUF3592 domain-containing protein [Telmatocola sphagniphila]|uniref:DUF3592 domain-containing protein n=1 Tax=Telmatocola sphagniphila TaxID=1123043 RepID=A0A8E6BBK0_9BACT|nr:DUF3592 domain-containing protein [Telmatocola sphagniphila]